MDILRQIKWAWQRVYRGWDDRVIWSIDWYLCKMLPIWLRRLKETTHGIPSFDIDESFEESEARWDNILDEMADGFEATYNDILEGDSDDHEAAVERHNKTMDLFKEHFLDLWD